MIYVRDAKVGKRYKVDFADCCVAGSFEATLVEIVYDDNEGPASEYADAFVFDNGVRMTSMDAVDIAEVP